MNNKKFLLGVGAQKSGTTWLHNYLNNHPQTDMGFGKEYHILDAHTIDGFRGITEKIDEKISTQLKSYGSCNKALINRYLFLHNIDFYFDYFEGLLQKEQVKLTGDITPSYSGLSVDTLANVDSIFAKRNIDVVPLFVMRDPVERLQSMVRMKFKFQGIKPTLEQEVSKMKKIQNSGHDTIRSDYKRIIQSLDEVFSDRVMYLFFEDLFTEETIQKLCSRLGLSFEKARFDIPQNVSKTENILSSEDREYFMAEYSATYDFIYEYFGKDKIQRLWVK